MSARHHPDDWEHRVQEHGRVKSLLESFAYGRYFGGLFGKTVPLYAESYWYAMGGLTFTSLGFLLLSGVVLAAQKPYWWLTSPLGFFVKSFHYWSAQAFFFFMILHAVRVWATGSYRGRRVVNWWIGIVIFLVALAENFAGILARGDWESQFVAMHANDMLFYKPYFFHLINPANFGFDLMIHIAVIPAVLGGLVLAHIVFLRIHGISPPLEDDALTAREE